MTVLESAIGILKRSADSEETWLCRGQVAQQQSHSVRSVISLPGLMKSYDRGPRLLTHSSCSTPRSTFHQLHTPKPSAGVQQHRKSATNIQTHMENPKRMARGRKLIVLRIFADWSKINCCACVTPKQITIKLSQIHGNVLIFFEGTTLNLSWKTT